MAKITKATIKDTLLQGQAEGLITDAALATRLRVAPSTIQRYRVACGVPVVDKFAANFERKYGAGSYGTLVQALANGDSLTAIGRRFHFTKQYAAYVRDLLHAKAGAREGA